MSSYPLYLLLSGPQPDTSSSQPRFTDRFHLGISKPTTSSSHLRLLYSSGRAAPGRTQVGADLGLHHPGNPRVPAQLILYRMWRLVVSSHSQSLEFTGLGKSFPLTCQQQSRLNYKKRVYSVHMKGTPRVPSLGHRGGCATGPSRTPTILGHTTKTQSHSSST